MDCRKIGFESKEHALWRLKKLMKTPIFVDLRNVYDPGKMREAGIIRTDLPKDDPPEMEEYYLWHHEGRKYRMGASNFLDRRRLWL